MSSTATGTAAAAAGGAEGVEQHTQTDPTGEAAPLLADAAGLVLARSASGHMQRCSVPPPPVPSPEEFDAQLQLRRVDFDMRVYLRASWDFFKPNLWRFIFAELIIAAIFLTIQITGSVFNAIFLELGEGQPPSSAMSGLYHLLFDILPGPFIYDPIQASAFYAVMRAMRENKLLEVGDFFVTFEQPYYFALLGLIALRLVLTVALLAVLVLPGLWFVMCAVFAYPLHYEHGHLGAWGAIKGSITVVMHYFCPMFFFETVMLLMQLLGVLCFGVGLFVTIPLALGAMCYCYHHLVGINGMPVLHVHNPACSRAARCRSLSRGSQIAPAGAAPDDSASAQTVPSYGSTAV